MQKSKLRALSLIELVIAMVVVGILAIMTVPYYRTYVIKSRVAEGFKLIRPCQVALEEYINIKNAFPSIDLASGAENAISKACFFDSSAYPDTNTNVYQITSTSSLTVPPVIQVTFKTSTFTDKDSNRYSFAIGLDSDTYTANTGYKRLVWYCKLIGSAYQLDDSYLPSTVTPCRAKFADP